MPIKNMGTDGDKSVKFCPAGIFYRNKLELIMLLKINSTALYGNL